MSVLFAATHPGRTSALVMCGSVAKVVRDEGYPWGLPAEQLEDFIRLCEEQWGGPVMVELFAPSMAHDAEFRDSFSRRARMAASPGAAVGYIRMNFDVDVRDVLPAVRVPTLVLNRTGDRLFPPEAGRDLAAHIPGARFVELPGSDHLPWVGDTEALVGEVEEFLTGIRHGPDEDRVLATVLFTDIVSSTERAGQLGDRGWKDLLDAHDDLTRRQVERFRGRVVKFTGDGVLATFDGPARAVRCATSLRDAVADLGVEVRAGLHTGEIEIRGRDIGGIAVHIAQRICSVAASREIIASSTVKDLVAGSGLSFADRGLHTLRGVPDEWRAFAVIP
jgi:class 3 adenylate cyclase